MKNNWNVIKHPLISNELVKLRNKTTTRTQFNLALKNIAKLLVFNVGQHLKTKKSTVETPFQTTTCDVVVNKIILIAILRAGLGMLSGFKSIIDNAKIGFIGLKRNKQDFQNPSRYYLNLPSIDRNSTVIILDPMIATGNTAIKAIREVQKINNKCQIIFVSIIVAKAAQKQIEQNVEAVEFITTQIDPILNAKKYIVPGFGDAGDRLFND